MNEWNWKLKAIVVYYDKRRWSCRDKYVGQHSVTIFLEEVNFASQCTFTGIYASCDRKLRRELWKELAAVYGLNSQPWVIGGDFNVIRFEDEKKGNARNTRVMRDFSIIISELCLMDSPLHGGSFAWFKGENNQSASRIDRFLSSESWDEQFKLIKQRVLPRVASDHCPILLECGDWSKGNDYFKFEDTWLEHKDFSDLVDNGGIHTIYKAELMKYWQKS